MPAALARQVREAGGPALSHLAITVADADLTVPEIMHTPIFGCAETTNTCPLDCEALALHVALCTRPALLTHVQDIATGVRVPAHLTPAEQLVSTDIAQTLLHFHAYFLVRKFAAGRLVLVGCLLRHSLILYPPQLHQHIDVMADICLHLLLTRMDKSFNQVIGHYGALRQWDSLRRRVGRALRRPGQVCVERGNQRRRPFFSLTNFENACSPAHFGAMRLCQSSRADAATPRSL
jgi:hypothetical protein